MKDSKLSAVSISVVVPFYNRSAHLERLLESLKRQTLKPHRVIIVDNGSALDECESAWKLIDKYSPLLNVVYVCSMQVGNANYARNAGALLADSSHIAFLDSDDWWSNDHLDSARKLLESSASTTSIYSSYVLHKPKGKRFVRNREMAEGESAIEFLFSFNRGFAQSSGLIVPASVAKAVLWSESLKRNQDYDFFCRVSRVSKWCLKKNYTVHVDWSHEEGKSIDYESVLRFYDESVRVSLKRSPKLIFLFLCIKESTLRSNGSQYYPELLSRLRENSFFLYFPFRFIGISQLRAILSFLGQ